MKRITRTITRTKATVTAFDMNENKVVNHEMLFRDFDNDKALAAVRKQIESDALRVIAVTPIETFSKKYAMDISAFVEKAQKIDGLKIGNINRTINEYLYTALVYNVFASNGNHEAVVEKREYTLDKQYNAFSDEALKALRKEYENSDERIIEAVEVKTIKGSYTISEADFMKYGYEIENDGTADE